jgi:hypothetical protein
VTAAGPLQRPLQPMSRGARLGMRIGALVGFTSWIVVLGAICACTGRGDVLLPIVLPLLLASLGLGLLVLVIVELAAADPRLQPLRATLVLGATWIAVGVLLLLGDAFVGPLLEQDAALARITQLTGGVARLPRWGAVLALTFGCVSLGVSLRRRGAAALPEGS